MTVYIIDIECTGLDPATDAILEIAVAQLSQERKIKNSHARLVNPGRPIPPESSAIHHLIDEDVKDEKFIGDVISVFDGAHAYVAHNAAFESSFLTPLWGAKQWICTMKCALRVWPEAPGHSNQVLRYWLGLNDPMGISRHEINPHRALSDCYTTAAIFVRLLDHASWAQLVQWSAEPALYTKFSFGKHKGQRYDETDPSYLRWIVDKSDLDEGIKFSAKHWLTQPKTDAA